MKKSLLKSLALAALVLSFAACDPSVSSSSSIDDAKPVPVAVSIAEAIEWDYDSEEVVLVNDGKLVTITEVIVHDKFGNSIIVQQSEGDKIVDLYAVEVITAEPVSFGWKDIVNVTGTVGDIDGRPVIKNAVVSKVGDAPSLSYAPVLSRDDFDTFSSRRYSGMLVGSGVPGEGLVQVVTLPGTIVAGQASEFKVVFPGEKLDENNPIAIPVVVPAMTAADATIVNSFFADKNEGKAGTMPEPVEVGDAFGLFAPLHWVVDTMGFVFSANVGAVKHDGFFEVENVFDDWGDLGIDELFISPMPDLSKEGTSIFSYVLDFSNVEISGNYAQGLLIMAHTEEADDDYDTLIERILADTQLEWEILDENSNQVLIGGFADPEDEEALSSVQLDNMGMYINIWLSGEIEPLDDGEEEEPLEWEEAIEMFEEGAADFLGEDSYTTTLPEYADPLATNFEFDDKYAASAQWNIFVYTDPSSTYDWGEDLIAAGFVFLGLDEYGDPQYGNIESGELVIIDSSSYLEEEGVIVIYILLVVFE